MTESRIIINTCAETTCRCGLWWGNGDRALIEAEQGESTASQQLEEAFPLGRALNTCDWFALWNWRYRRGRIIRSFFIRKGSVDRFIPSRIAAPLGPTQPTSSLSESSESVRVRHRPEREASLCHGRL